MEAIMVKKRGFTLLELLIVIGLIGILISIAAVSYSSAQKRSRDARRMQDVKAVSDAMEQYYADSGGTYPTSEVLLTTDNKYLPAGMPKDPKTSLDYTIAYDADGVDYCACATLEGTNGNATNTSCTFGTGPFYCVKNLQ